MDMRTVFNARSGRPRDLVQLAAFGSGAALVAGTFPMVRADGQTVYRRQYALYQPGFGRWPTDAGGFTITADELKAFTRAVSKLIEDGKVENNISEDAYRAGVAEREAELTPPRLF